MVKGKQALYLHPMEFSGIILAEEIPSVQNAIRAARSFRLRNIGRFEFYQEMSDEDYKAYLDSRREEMIGDILARYKTGRKNISTPAICRKASAANTASFGSGMTGDMVTEPFSM